MTEIRVPLMSALWTLPESPLAPTFRSSAPTIHALLRPVTGPPASAWRLPIRSRAATGTRAPSTLSFVMRRTTQPAFPLSTNRQFATIRTCVLTTCATHPWSVERSVLIQM